MIKLPFNRLATVFLVAWAIAQTCFPTAAEAGNFRLRAREEFEHLSIRYGPLNTTQAYFGPVSTINAWYE